MPKAEVRTLVVGQSSDVGVHTPAFRRLWWAWTVSLFGDGVRGLALPLYVAIETHSPLAASAVMVAEVLPWLLVALPAGAIVDRRPARGVVVIAHMLRATLTGALAIAVLTGTANLVVVCILAFLLAAAETFAYPASQVLMVQLAGKKDLTLANSRFYTVHTIGLNLAGPAAAGLALTVHPAIAFGVDALTFVVAALLVHTLPSSPAHGNRDERTATGLVTQIRDGVKALFSVGGLRALIVVIMAATIAVAAVNALTPLYAIHTLRLSPAVVSTLLIVMAIGTLVGARLVVPLARYVTDGLLLVVSMTLVGLSMIVLGAFSAIAAALSAFAMLGLGTGGFNVLAATRRQRLTPADSMGRISGAYRMVAWGLMPLGAGVAGPLAVATSLGWVFVMAGGLVLAVLVVAARDLLLGGAAPRHARSVRCG